MEEVKILHKIQVAEQQANRLKAPLKVDLMVVEMHQELIIQPAAVEVQLILDEVVIIYRIELQ